MAAEVRTLDHPPVNHAQRQRTPAPATRRWRVSHPEAQRMNVMDGLRPSITMATQRYDNTDGRMRGRKLVARRERKWIEAGGRCAICHRLLSLNAKPHEFELDHIEALKADGGKGEDTDENTQVLCCGPEGCHRKKTAKDMGWQERRAVGPDGWPS